MTILLVDDHFPKTATLDAVLAPLEERLLHASSGAEAVAIAAREELSLILLDLQMPELDGLETAALLKRSERTRAVPIIILTSQEPTRAMIERGQDSGALDFLMRPLDVEVVRSRIAELVELHRDHLERVSAPPDETPFPAPTSSSRAIDATLYEEATDARKRAELAEIEIRASESRLRVALASAGVGTWDFDPRRGIMRWDARSKSLFGLEPDDYVDYGRFVELTHPEDRARLTAAVKLAFDPQGDGKFDCDCRVDSEDERWIGCKGHAIFERGSAIRFTGTFMDVTAKKRVERERVALLARERAARTDAEKARARAEAASRAKDEFLATVSHELRNPLNAILGWSRVLVEEDCSRDPTRLQKGLAVILRNAKAQVQLVEDILEVSRIVTGKLRLQTGVLDVKSVVEAALETVRAAAHAKGVSLAMRCLDAEGTIIGDVDRVQQVLWNLLSNAVKFTPRGGTVTVEIRRDSDQMHIAVMDSGEGIAPDFLPFVFDRFRQADGSTTRKHGGLGLGLAIVRHLVELHGGTVSAESEGLGKGAVFRVALPIHAQVAEPPASEAAYESEPRLLAAPKAPLADTRVLVVDDEEDMRDLIAIILESAGAIVTRVPTVNAALRALETDVFDVALSDLAMPGEDGYDFVRQARERGVKVPLVAMTAYARAEDRHRVLAAGFRRHVAKPIEPAELVSVLAHLLRKRLP